MGRISDTLLTVKALFLLLKSFFEKWFLPVYDDGEEDGDETSRDADSTGPEDRTRPETRLEEHSGETGDDAVHSPDAGVDELDRPG